MADTPAEVRRDIELTRERMSSTLAQLEQKMNVMQLVRDNPWPAIGLAVGAGFLLSGSKADVKAAAATTLATRGASSRVGNVLDDLMANLMTAVTGAMQQRVEGWVGEIKTAIGAPTNGASGGTSTNSSRNFASGNPTSASASQSDLTPSSAGSQAFGRAD